MISLAPRMDFRADEDRLKRHAKLCESSEFHHALQTALLTLQQRQVYSNLTEASASAIKLKGAQEFVSILLNLSEPEKPGAEPQLPPLNPV